MGMMSWAFMTMCFAMKQRAVTGHVASSMLVSVILQSVSRRPDMPTASGWRKRGSPQDPWGPMEAMQRSQAQTGLASEQTRALRQLRRSKSFSALDSEPGALG